MTVTTVIQKTQVDGVGSLVITDITQDPTTGNYGVRSRLTHHQTVLVTSR